MCGANILAIKLKQFQPTLILKLLATLGFTMGFIKEFVPEDQKNKFDPEIFDWGLAYPRARPYRWVVDVERDIFLMCTGRQGSGGGQGDGYIPPEFFSFSYQKQLIKFKAEITALGSNERGWTVNWVIFDFKMPSTLESEREEVMNFLIEAIEIHGNSVGQNINKLLAVNVSFK